MTKAASKPSRSMIRNDASMGLPRLVVGGQLLVVGADVSDDVEPEPLPEPLPEPPSRVLAPESLQPATARVSALASARAAMASLRVMCGFPAGTGTARGAGSPTRGVCQVAPRVVRTATAADARSSRTQARWPAMKWLLR